MWWGSPPAPHARAPAVRTARIFLAAALIVLVAGATLATVALGTRKRAPVGIDPKAPLNSARQYHLVVWDYRLPLTSPGAAPYSEGPREVLEDFERRHPNVTVDLLLVDLADGQAKLAEALAAGYPPDVYCSPYGPPAVGSDLQVPLGLYIDYEIWSRFDPVAWQTVKVDETIWALPRWLQLWPWLGNRDLLEKVGVDPAHVSRSGWTREEFSAAASATAGSASVPGGPVFLGCLSPAAAFRDLLLAGHLAAPEAPAASDYWLGPEPGRTADWLGTLRNAGGPATIEAFLRGKVAVLAGPSPWAASFLMEFVERRDPWQFSLPRRKPPPPMVLLPPPSDPDHPSITWSSAATVTLFRQARYRGDDNTRLAAEVALELAQGLRPWLAGELLCVPATLSEQASWRLRCEKSGEAGAFALHMFERLQGLPQDRLSPALTCLNYGAHPEGSGKSTLPSTSGYLGPFLQGTVSPAAIRFWQGQSTAEEMMQEITSGVWRGP
jgi:hypothetical protein